MIIKDKLIRDIFVEIVINIEGHFETVHKNVTDIVTLPHKPPKCKKRREYTEEEKNNKTNVLMYWEDTEIWVTFSTTVMYQK